jgi:hypothetical protein
VYINTITIPLTIAPEFSSVKTCNIHVLTELNSGAMVRVIVIVLIYSGFNRAELGCYGQSYSDPVDIHVNTITITLTIAPEFRSVKTSIYQHDHYNSGYSPRVQLG